MKQETEQDGATAQVSKPLCAIVLKETFGLKLSANKSQYPCLCIISWEPAQSRGVVTIRALEL